MLAILLLAAAFQTLASQLSDLTGGEDGLSFKLPALLMPSTQFLEQPFLGVSVDGRLLTYYLLFFAALGLLLALLRIVNSPFGRVLQAIRENEFRAEAIGYRVVVYRTTSSVLSAKWSPFIMLPPQTSTEGWTGAAGAASEVRRRPQASQSSFMRMMTPTK